MRSSSSRRSRRATPQQLRLVWSQVEPWKTRLGPILSTRLDDPNAPPQAHCHYACGLARLGLWDAVWPLLKNSTNPELRSRLIQRLPDAGVTPRPLLHELRRSREPSVRQAILLILGGFADGWLSAGDREAIAAECQGVFQYDPDAGVHSAAEWLLRKWGGAPELQTLAGRPARGNWFVNPKGMTIVVFTGPVSFLMGSPKSEPQRDLMEVQRTRRIGRSFAIGAHEVTVEQFLHFRGDLAGAADVTPSADCPANHLSWFDAVRFCRWLTEEEGLGEDQQCYPEEVGPDMKLPEDFFRRKGYRLPTEAEWEYACRAGSTTSRFLGDGDSTLTDYAWFNKNSEDHLWPVGSLRPNAWGLFDVYGNTLEWCQNDFRPELGAGAMPPADDDEFRNDPNAIRILRGGRYSSSPREIRSAKRLGMAPESKYSIVGLRVARTLE